MTHSRTQNLPFKPRARLLLLLGDQLIRDPGIAVFELVKNAYDACASSVKVTMRGLDKAAESWKRLQLAKSALEGLPEIQDLPTFTFDITDVPHASTSIAKAMEDLKTSKKKGLSASKQKAATSALAILEELTEDLQHLRSTSIVVEDDGEGMDWDLVTGVWLEPGTDYRKLQKETDSSKRKNRCNRLPLGEKGVGRFAAHKLGDKITLITRKAGNQEVTVTIDWDSFEKATYLSDVKISVSEGEPKHFTGKASGTRIEIHQLRNPWTAGMVKDLHRSVTSICSPFNVPDRFSVDLTLKPDPKWLAGMPTVADVLESSLFRAKIILTGKLLRYRYEFDPYSDLGRVEGRRIPEGKWSFSNYEGKWHESPIGDDDGTAVDLSRYQIGQVEIDLYIFDLDPQVLALGAIDRKALREFLARNGGIRVYRDGIRVYDYGEPGNDWLKIDVKRVNLPTGRISSNMVVGAVSLSLKDSQDLVEKTNREGFVETPAMEEFRKAVLFAVHQIQFERNLDKARIRNSYSKSPRKPVLDNLEELKQKIETKGLGNELLEYVSAIEKEYKSIQDRLLTAASAGLTMAVVIHEVEKGVEELSKAVDREKSSQRIVSLARHLSELIAGLTYLTRKSGQSSEKASTLISQALFNNEYRLEHHNITSSNNVADGVGDFSVKCTRRLIIATLMNLIDNSIYWLNTKGGNSKAIFVSTASIEGNPAIVVADNGPGFQDLPEYLIEPFITRKPDGMGLGLHIASEVMKAHGGKLAFPSAAEVGVPKEYSGAVVALVFPRTE